MNLYLATDEALAVLTNYDNRCQCTMQLHNQQAQCVAVNPLRPELVYCGTFGNGLWRSDDAGRNWRPAGDGIKHAKVFSIAVSQTERIHGHNVIYAGTEPSAVFRSEDGGNSWRECLGLTELPSAGAWSFPPRPNTHHARWIHADPHARGRLFVAIEAGALVRSLDGGATWVDRVPTGPIDTHQLVTHRSASGRLYSAAGDGYFESTDAGETWQHLEEGLQHRYVWSIAVDAGDADTRIIASAASARHSHDKNAAVSVLHRRTADTSWQQIRNGLPEATGRRTAVLAAHPHEAGMFYAAWENDIFRSIDGGATWQQVYIPWPNGFDVGEPRALAVTTVE